MLEAAGQAAVRTGAPVNVHVSPYGREGVGIARRLTSLGVPPERVVLSHMDSNTALDREYHRELLELGIVIEFDNFGCENYSVQSGRFLRNNSDYERMQHIAELVAEGYGRQLTIGCDVYTKTQLTSFGGLGYDHLHKRIAPTLLEWFDVDASAIEEIVRNTPRRLLDWA
ncbi:phosphotriesterase family protein [Kribbella sp. VKM Ac-2527]|uniref:Phosphotriesterase family protein n=1 Tax=Kribbella caucasensis TaxID=2512215 RepID=A0A4R6KHG8_9ACTN|nr:phosphotriesterase family protein [Kribbella sp. VKM Ac-2527]